MSRFIEAQDLLLEYQKNHDCIKNCGECFSCKVEKFLSPLSRSAGRAEFIGSEGSPADQGSVPSSL